MLPVALFVALATALWRRPAIDGYRALVFAFGVTYAISFV